MDRKLSSTKKITLGGMIVALSLLCLFAASMLPAGRVPLCFLSSIVIVVLAGEGAYGAALLSYLACSVLAFFTLPDKLPAYTYILLLGHYGIFRTIIHARVQGRVLRAALKLVYCDTFLCLGIFLANAILGGLPLALPAWLPLWGLVALTQPILVIYDLLFGASIAIYQSHIRHFLLSRN